MIQLRRHEKDLFINLGQPESMASSLKKWSASRESLRTELARLDAIASAVSVQGPLGQLHGKLGEYERVFRAVDAEARAGGHASTQTAVKAMGSARAAFHDAERAADDISRILNGRAEAGARSLADTAAFSTHLMMLFAAGTIAVGLGLGWVFSRSITLPIGDAVRVARAVAQGDLSTRFEVRGRDEAAELLQALGDMTSNLVRLVGAVRASSDSIACGSRQIAAGNCELSERTEEQASNLQQTAASMEQLHATVKSSAATGTRANQMATDAVAAATKGGEVVTQVMGTMESISDSSKRIADIVGVIDGIAFQTNILALNAAVEAARAGEQGRGFAVVAGEVRSLAQRSARAAKEVKGLIDTSVERVAQGKHFADNAGAVIGHLAGQVDQVAGMIAQITAMTSEQNIGIGQVTHAVSQLDEVTQQNAALVEESAAATESLKDQALKLVDSVAVFRLDAQATALAGS
jgi:methyl-accepting chemotaxis protein